MTGPVEPICGKCGVIAPTIGHSCYQADTFWYPTVKALYAIEKKIAEEAAKPKPERLKCAAGNHKFPPHEKFSGNSCECIVCNNCVLIHYMEGNDSCKA